MNRPAPSEDGAPVRCAHCGLDVPPHLVRDHERDQFCCAGCRQVHTLIHEWGFDRYYRLIEQQQATIGPAQVSGRDFSDFDDPHMQSAATAAIGDGRLRTRLYVEGVHCTACIWLVEKLPAVLSGVDDIRLNFGSGVADVTWQPAQTRLSTVARAFDRLGYTPHVHQASRTQDVRRAEDRAMLARFGVAVACAMNLMFVSGALYAGEASGMAAPYASFFRWFALVIAVPLLGFSARPFFQTAMGGLRAGMVHIDLPIAIGIAAGATASAISVFRGSGPVWFDSLAMLIAALLGARQLQRSAQRAALERADSLRGVAFLEFARRIDGNGHDADTVEVPIGALEPGDRVEVRSGELIPVDGIVIAGRSSLNNAVLTGEATPLPVGPGDAVNAGATNLGARLTVRVTAAGAHTRVGALLALVQEALSRKPALLAVTDALARRFVIILLIVAAATAVVVWQVKGPEAALSRVIALLVVSCPCALGLSVPLAMSMALMRAARAGIFIKNPDALARLRRVRTVLLDKTGTLTEGRSVVTQWHGSPSVLEMARTLEGESSHAVARAFQASGAGALHLVRSVTRVGESPGLGISGVLDGQEVRVGNRQHVTAGGAAIPVDVEHAAHAMAADGLSPVFVSVDRCVEAVAGLGDRLRGDARHTVRRLRDRGVAVRILSGDDPEIVRRIGRELELDPGDALGGLTPEMKRDLVAEIVAAQRANGSVVMVGDGVNDAAALALADVGIAVHGGMGATIAAADVVFTRGGVTPVLDLIDGARRLDGVVRRNIAFSLLYNLVASSLAVAGIVGPLLAAVLMPVSSLTVVLSSVTSRTFAGPSAPRRARAGEA